MPVQLKMNPHSLEMQQINVVLGSQGSVQSTMGLFGYMKRRAEEKGIPIEGAQNEVVRL